MGFELGTDGPAVIVAAVDGSRTSLRAAAYAAGLSRRQGTRLVVVHVMRPPVAAGLVPAAGVLAEQAVREAAEDLRRTVMGAAQSLGIEAQVLVRRGDPYGEVCRACDEVRADSVVVGASSGAGHRLLGSLAVRLVRAGRWPVTVVP